MTSTDARAAEQLVAVLNSGRFWRIMEQVAGDWECQLFLGTQLETFEGASWREAVEKAHAALSRMQDKRESR
jgi:hypothetical protein